jgi:hypothetical protein
MTPPRAILLFLAGLLLAGGWHVVNTPGPLPDTPRYRELSTIQRPDSTYAELVLVYLGSSGCAASNAAFLPAAVAQLQKRLAMEASKHGMVFTSIGVAKDASVHAGLDHLDRTASFDEIAVGGSWRNVAIQRYVFGKVPGRPATPQLVLLERRVSGATARVEDVDVLLRKVGSTTIRRWSEGPGDRVPPT